MLMCASALRPGAGRQRARAGPVAASRGCRRRARTAPRRSSSTRTIACPATTTSRPAAERTSRSAPAGNRRSWPMRPAIRTSTPACAGKRSTIRVRPRRSSTSVRRATCPSRRRWRTPRAGSRRSCADGSARGDRGRSSRARMACRARSVIRWPSDGLGTRASFNGNFVLRPTRPDGVREIFGPFAVDRGTADDHAFGDRVRAGGGAARAAVRALCVLPHADHSSLRA